MLKREYTLSDLVDYFKKHQIPSFEEDIDGYSGYFFSAATIAAIFLAPNPLAALSNFCTGIGATSFRISKLFSWLPDKFKYANKGREKLAIDRYQLASIIYIRLLDIALMEGFSKIIAPTIKYLLEGSTVDESDRETLVDWGKRAEASQYKIEIDTFARADKAVIKRLIGTIIHPLLTTLEDMVRKHNDQPEKSKKKFLPDSQDILSKYADETETLFNAFLIHFSTEFPEFNLWCEINDWNRILDELTSIRLAMTGNSPASRNEVLISTEETIKQLESFKQDQFTKAVGLPSFDEVFQQRFKLQTDSLIEKLDGQIRADITAHYNMIRMEIEKPLSDNTDIEGIVYSRIDEIYIAQSFRMVDYQRKDHGKVFLTVDSFDGISRPGQDLGKMLIRRLVDPKASFRPIIVLGNPGAGKTMFSKIFAAKLCDSLDYIPFLVKLRNVASSSANIAEHINKGIAQSIGLTREINWIDWARTFATRIPVIILDGFDELLQCSKTELNGYINAIKELQEAALHHKICLRVILTSRIAVMQDVSIPDGTTIIKLNPFDDVRKQLWISKWNACQTKHEHVFSLPWDEKIRELSQEPLLLFMLAVYDFSAGELQAMTKDQALDQSKLYDSLLTSFGLRQLRKEHYYRNAGDQQKQKEQELFRLRIGMIALLMFIGDTTNKDIHRLEDELKVCRLADSKIKPIDVLAGFFFIHQNKATAETRIEHYNYEFLHRSFGEFLTADFLLRTAFRLKDRNTCDKELFHFCFGYNWLHKQPEVLRFLFEHGPQVFDLEGNQQDHIIGYIRESLAELFDKTINEFPIPRFTIAEHKDKLSHLAIYSQNLVVLWMALSPCHTPVPFSCFPENRANTDIRPALTIEKWPVHFYQDKEETHPDKLLWKRMVGLWQMVGNYRAAAMLHEWVEVYESDVIMLKPRRERTTIVNGFHEAAVVGCNDINYIHSIMGIPAGRDAMQQLLQKCATICRERPELSFVAMGALINKIPIADTMFPGEGEMIIRFLADADLYDDQVPLLTGRFLSFSSFSTPVVKAEIGAKLLHLMISGHFYRDYTKLIIHLLPYYHLKPLSRLKEDINIAFNHFISTTQDDPGLIVVTIELIRELTRSDSTRWMERPGLIHSVLEMLLPSLKELIRDTPLLAIDFIQIIKSFGRAGRIRDHLKIDDLLTIFAGRYPGAGTNEQGHLPNILLYLKLLTELQGYVPVQQLVNTLGFHKMLESIRKDIMTRKRVDLQLVIWFLVAIPLLVRDEEFRQNLIEPIMRELIDQILLDIKDYDIQGEFLNFESMKLINELCRKFPVKDYASSIWATGVIRIFSEQYKYNTNGGSQYAIELIRFAFNFDEEHQLTTLFPGLKKLNADPELAINDLHTLVKILRL